MIRLTLYCALILTLISCPLRCFGGLQLFSVLGIQMSDQSVAEGCPACCSKPESQPAKSSENSPSDCGCSCLCGGAILLVDCSVEQMAPQAALHGILNDVAGPAQECCSDLRSQRFAPLEPDGRALRTRLMSFVC